jgi:hypothetical protein
LPKVLELLKLGVLSVLLLGIFSLPALSATQLVGVLGIGVVKRDVGYSVLGDKTTIITDKGKDFVVSYTRSGQHPLLRVENSSGGRRTLRLSISSARDVSILSQKVELVVGRSEKLILFDHSTLPFNREYAVAVLPGKVIDLSLDVWADKDTSSFGTIELRLAGF